MSQDDKKQGPREFWLGISETNIAHIDTKQRWSSDYHVIEYSAYLALEKERDILKAKESQFESTLKETMRERDKWREWAKRLAELCKEYRNSEASDLDADELLAEFERDKGNV